MHLLWYLQNTTRFREYNFTDKALRFYCIFFLLIEYIGIIVFTIPLNKPVFEPIVYDVLLCTVFFFLLIFCRLFKICLKRDKHTIQLLLAYCSRNCVYKNY